MGLEKGDEGGGCRAVRREEKGSCGEIVGVNIGGDDGHSRNKYYEGFKRIGG